MKNYHSCMFNHELLVAYATRSVTPGERVTVERHLAQCAACRQEIKELENTWLALDVWSENVETVRPRLNDLRLRLSSAQRKPSFRERFWSALEPMMTPLRLVPASPVLAVIVTGLFAYVGFQTEWGTESSLPSSQPSFAIQPQSQSLTHPTIALSPEVSPTLVPSVADGAQGSIVDSMGQVNSWNSLVQNSNTLFNSNVMIRMATNGLDYVNSAHFPTGAILSRYNGQSSLPSADSMRTLNGELVRLK